MVTEDNNNYTPEEGVLDLSGGVAMTPDYVEPPTTPEPPVEQPVITDVVPAEPPATPEPPTAAASEPEPIEVPDEFILQVLSEKLGREVKDFEDIKPKEVELNPQIKAIADWAEKTGRPVEDWVKYNKDYSTIPDIDKAREILELKYPTLTKQEIDFELGKYSIFDDDLDEDKTLKSLELKKLVADNESLLENNRLKLGDPVEGYSKLTPEIQEQLEYAKSVKEGYEKAILDQQVYEQSIQKSIEEFDTYDINLTDELSIRYSLTPEDKKELPEFLTSMPHWYNEDGSTNHAAITRDTFTIKNFDKIVKMAFEQGEASGLEKATKTANNITLDNPTTEPQPDAGSGIVIEGNYKSKGVKAIYGKR